MTARYAHEVAPEPGHGDYLDATPGIGPDATPGIAQRVAAYHAARAYGLWLGAQAGHTSLLLAFDPEYRLAVLWRNMLRGYTADVDFAAGEVGRAAHNPATAGTVLEWLLRLAGIDPETIKPYTTQPEPTDTAEAGTRVDDTAEPGPEVTSVTDRHGRVWRREPGGAVLVLDDGPETTLAGWKHGATTYYQWDTLVQQHGPMTYFGPASLPDERHEVHRHA